MRWQTVFWVLPLAVAVGCGNAGKPGLLQTLLQPLAAADTGPAPAAADLRAALTPAVLRQIGAPVIVADVPTIGGAAVLVAVATQNGVTTYLSGDGSSVSMQGGLIVATRGLGFDLMVADVGAVATALDAPPQRVTRTHHYLDGENHVVMRQFTCEVGASDRGVVVEHCTGPETTFENRYFLTDKGAMTQTRQWISPRIGWITITFPGDAGQS